MNKIKIGFFISLFGLCVLSCTEEQDAKLKDDVFNPLSFVDELRKSVCPDKRVCVFDIQQDSSTGVWQGELSNAVAYKTILEIFSEKDIEHQIKLIPDESILEPYGLIRVSTAQLRGAAKHSSELVSQGLLGQPVSILKKEGDWFYVQLVDGYLGWMESLSITSYSEADLDVWNSSERAFVLNKNLDVYNEQGQIITELVAANIISLIDEPINKQQKIKLPDGQIGFTYDLQFLRSSEWKNMLPNPESIIGIAKTYMGIPYVWGGTSTKGFDCSGFTKNIFLLNGMQLPRDASQQVQCGKTIDTNNGFENLKKGDLLFFGKKASNNKKERITHVAIYLDNASFIHASGEVKIQSLDPSSEIFAPDRLETFIRAKRISNDCIGTYAHKL